MQRLEVSGAVRLIYMSLGVKRLIKNLRNWSPVNRRELQERPLSLRKHTEWCSVGMSGTVGTILFKNDKG